MRIHPIFTLTLLISTSAFSANPPEIDSLNSKENITQIRMQNPGIPGITALSRTPLHQLTERLRAVGLRMAYLAKGVHIPAFTNEPTIAEILETVADTNQLELTWLNNNSSVVLWRKSKEFKKEILGAGLSSDDKKERDLAIWKAADSEDLRALKLLLKVAKVNEEAARETARAITRCHHLYDAFFIDAEIAGTLAQYALEDESPIIRKNAVGALFWLDRKDAERFLKRSLSNKDPKVRKYSLALAFQIGSDKVLQLVKERLKDRDYSVQKTAYSILGKIGGDQSLDLLQEGLNSKRKEIQLAALHGLAYFESPKALRILDKVFQNHDDVFVRATALIAAAKIAPLSAADKIDVALDDPEESIIRHAAAEAIKYVKGPRGFALIQKGLKSQEKVVRAKAGIALATSIHPLAKQMAISLLNDSEAEVRKVAVSVLGTIGGRDVRDSLLTQFQIDESALVKLSIRAALMKYFRNDPIIRKMIEKARKGKPAQLPDLNNDDDLF